MAREFELNGHQYVVGRMSVLDAADIAAKILPLLPPLMKAAAGNGSLAEINREISAGNVNAGQAIMGLLDNIEGFLQAQANMPDEHRRAIMSRCFATVSRRVGSTLVQVWNEQAKGFQFEELDNPTCAFRFVREVIAEKVLPFLPALQSLFTG